jgi:protein SCO1/2
VSVPQSTTLALGALAAVMAGGLGLWLGLRGVAPSTPPGADPFVDGGYVVAPRPLEHFELVDGDGRPFGREQLRGHWSFVYFGYTHCPDVCPLTLVELARLKERIAAACSGVVDRYYLVSVDPRRDTPERLREYVAYFDPEFAGLTGPPAQIDKLTAQVGAVYTVPEAPDSDEYLVGHSSTVTVLDPEGRHYAVLTAPHTAAGMLRGFAQILDRASAPGSPAQCAVE